MKSVVTFGELMLRLSPPGYQRLVQAHSLDIFFGGAEANVAVALAQFGIPSRFITKLPNNPLGQAAFNYLRGLGIDTSFILRGGERMGIYYVEKGASQRPSNVIYDRSNSSFQKSSYKEWDWDKIFEEASWFHITGITPALGEDTAKACLEACKIARRKGITVSCDINYRGKLWSREKACEVMSQIFQYVDICIANEEDAYNVFDIKTNTNNLISGNLNLDQYKNIAEEICKRFYVRSVAITLRKSISASENKWSAILYDNKEFYHSKEYNIHIVDRVGGGDAFVSGIIFGFLNKMPIDTILEYGSACGCLKQTIDGDFLITNTDEILKLIKGDGSGRIQR